MAKKYYMSESELTNAFNKFKDTPAIQDALEKGWFIYLRKNGFITLNPESLQSTTKVVNKNGNITYKTVKAKISKADFKKIENNYVLYN